MMGVQNYWSEEVKFPKLLNESDQPYGGDGLQILLKLGIVVYRALDYNLPTSEDCQISHELEELIDFMTSEDNDDEGIERDSEEVEEDLVTVDSDGDCPGSGSLGDVITNLEVVSVAANGCSGGERKHLETKELDHVLEVSVVVFHPL
uniref:KIND domain-containing protein n=1 Tax=Anopheles culicifacies TaxID=139723 RepID=A0A182MEL7_9DIPT